jgi:RsiW-degrading membrane proteinase PrsW (M82 family)
MSWYVLLLLSFSPGLFWLWYFYQKDKLEPEPKWLIIRTFLFGMIAVFPAGFLEWIAVEYINGVSAALNIIILAPIIEELCKYFSVRYTVYLHDEFDEPMDGIVYAAAAALGFASLENLGYVLSVYWIEDPEIDALYHTGMVVGVSATRAVLSVPGHVLFSAMWGYALGVTKCIIYPRRTNAYISTGVVLSIILHSVFNLLLTVPLAMIFILIYMVYIWKMINLRIKTALQNSPHLPIPAITIETNSHKNSSE